jgi:hypothetical protein
MHRTLLVGEVYRWAESELYYKKLNDYARKIKKGGNQEAA